MSDANALVVSLLLDRQREIEALRAEVERLQSVLAQTSREDS